METFAYKAASAQGHVIEGRRAAQSRAALIADLHAGGYVPIRIEPMNGGRRTLSALQFLPRKNTLPAGAVAVLVRELATLLGAGIPVDRALAIAQRSAGSAAQKAALTATREELRAGTTLGAALRANFAALPASALSLIEAGEAAGKIAPALVTIADAMESQRALIRTLTGALLYPAILLLTSIVSILFLLAFVVPQFSAVFESAGASLPLSTAMLIAVGEGIRTYGLLALLGIALGIAGLLRWRQEPAGRAAIDALLLRTPLISVLVKKFEIARLSATLAALLEARLNHVRALALAQDGIGNSLLKDSFRQAALRTKEGESLAAHLGKSGLWPADAVEMIAVGEEAGELAAMLKRLADLYQADLKRQTERLIALLTPALTLLMGGLVAAIVGAVISAILGAYDLPL